MNKKLISKSKEWVAHFERAAKRDFENRKNDRKVMADIDISLKNLVYFFGIYLDTIFTEDQVKKMQKQLKLLVARKAAPSVFRESLQYNNVKGRDIDEEVKKFQKESSKKDKKTVKLGSSSRKKKKRRSRG